MSHDHQRMSASNEDTRMNEPGTTWIDAAYKIGVPSAIAVFLVWWLTSTVAANLATIQTRLNDHITATNQYLYAICKHTAKTEDERADCSQR